MAACVKCARGSEGHTHECIRSRCVVCARCAHGLSGAHQAACCWLVQVVPTPPHIAKLEQEPKTWMSRTPTTLVPTFQELTATQRQTYGAHVTQPFMAAGRASVLYVGQVVGMADRSDTKACAECLRNNIRRCNHLWCVRWADQEVSGEWVPSGREQKTRRAKHNRGAGKENMNTGRWSKYLSTKDVADNQLCQVCLEPIEEVGSWPKKKRKNMRAVRQHVTSAEAHPLKILLCESRTGCSGAVHVKCAPDVRNKMQLPDVWYCSEACRKNTEKN